MSSFYEERVLSVWHWTDALFSFTATRDPSFRFICGQFTMLGMTVDGRPLLRAYSMASERTDEERIRRSLTLHPFHAAGRAPQGRLKSTFIGPLPE
jgi:ferredoxin-NADP reductase